MRFRNVIAWGWIVVASPICQAAPPVAVDPSIVIEKVASEPDLVTPVGVAVDATGRVLVVESHTHFRPKDYPGPPADRIRTFEDDDGDGKPERVGTFFEGSIHTMGLGVHPDGSVLVATRMETFRLRDEDADGKADGPPERLAHLDTTGDYPHNGLSGFAVDAEGRIVFGLGENLGVPYKLIGRDGTTLSGGGEGGNIYRIRADGSGLERIATGFWNPFHLAYEPFGRLFAVDNDPDSRPPCRLIDVVPGGDYGFKFRNGRKGIHPFTAWNGELPGTLPMAAGTGEAPSGIVSYQSDQLRSLRGSLLVTSWGDHRIDAFRSPTPTEAGRVSPPWERRPIVTGGEDFRPVGIAVGPDGSIYVSDWVDRSYDLHGKGRLWRIRARQPEPRVAAGDDVAALRHPDLATREAAARRLARDEGREPSAALRAAAMDPDPLHAATALDALITHGRDDEQTIAGALQHPSEWVRAIAVRRLPASRLDPATIAGTDPSPLVRAEALRRIGTPDGVPVLLRSLADPDPFLAQAAREGLRHTTQVAELLRMARHPAGPVRLGAVILLRDSGDPVAADALPRALEDPSPDVRLAALQWIADGRPGEFADRLNPRGMFHVSGAQREFFAILGALNRADGRSITPREFVAVLAALDRLEGREGRPKDELPGEAYVARLIEDRGGVPGLLFYAPILTQAIRMLRPDHPVLTDDRLMGFVRSGNPSLAVEALRTWRERPGFGRFDILDELVRAPETARSVRLEAIVGLALSDLKDPSQRGMLVQLAGGNDLAVRRESLRALRGAPLTTSESAYLEKSAARGDKISADYLDALAGFDTTSPEPPRPVADWAARLGGPGDVDAGARLFFHPKGPGCYRCHQYQGRGGRSGPDLTGIGRALSRERLIESILDPGKEVAPQFVTWSVATRDGRIVVGTRLGETVEGTEYGDADGRVVVLKPGDIEEVRPRRESLMPDGLHRLMTESEFRDLLAFLTEP